MNKLKADIFLASHGSFFGLLEKREKLRKGSSTNPFIDPDGYRRFLADTEKAFLEKLKNATNKLR
ncbi:MAG: hypothetical protein H7070_06385 [Saprospiraceae bacterium]|nr:hypothetical protein [Pyrinomonadaceae bacterium]